MVISFLTHPKERYGRDTMLLLSSLSFITFSLSVVVAPSCPKGIEANYEGCKTQHTSEAFPEDHRGRAMWSWTADQLRQRCATEFYRLDDGSVSSRFLIEQGADLYSSITILDKECKMEG